MSTTYSKIWETKTCLTVNLQQCGKLDCSCVVVVNHLLVKTLIPRCIKFPSSLFLHVIVEVSWEIYSPKYSVTCFLFIKTEGTLSPLSPIHIFVFHDPITRERRNNLVTLQWSSHAWENSFLSQINCNYWNC